MGSGESKGYWTIDRYRTYTHDGQQRGSKGDFAMKWEVEGESIGMFHVESDSYWWDCSSLEE